MAQDAGGSAGRQLLRREGADNLKAELESLITVKRQEVADRIKTATAFGDITENAEYDAAKNQQAFIEGRIREIEHILRSARIVEDDEVGLDAVGVGNAVRVYDIGFEEEDEYTIVGMTEADPKRLYVSSESPIGQALLGKRVNDVAEVVTPSGVVRLRVLEILKRKTEAAAETSAADE